MMWASTRRSVRCQMGRMAKFAFQAPEGALHFRQLDVLRPEALRLHWIQVCPQQVGSIPHPKVTQTLLVPAPGEPQLAGPLQPAFLQVGLNAGVALLQPPKTKMDLVGILHAPAGDALCERPQRAVEGDQLPPPHRAFLARPRGAARQHIGFPSLFDELHFDAFTPADFLPRAMEQLLLKLLQPPLRRAHQIRRSPPAQILQIVFADDPPIKHPDAPFVAVLGLDPLQHFLQRGHVGAIALEDLVAQRKALTGDHQRHDDLHAVGAMIAAVAAPGFGNLPGLAFKVGAGQIIEEDLAVRGEEILPAPLQMAEQRLLMLHRFVQRPVKPVLPSHALVAPQQDIHRRLSKPAFVNGELAPRRAKAARAPQLQAREQDFPMVAIHLRRGASVPIGKEPHLPGFSALLNDLDGPLPALHLGGVQFAEVQQALLHHAIASHPHAFPKRVVHVQLSVLADLVALQKHNAAEFIPSCAARLRGRLSHASAQRFLMRSSLYRAAADIPKKVNIAAKLRNSG